MKGERSNGLLDDGEEYLNDDFEVENSTPPMFEPWRIDGACVELCGQLLEATEQLAAIVKRLCSLYV